MIYYINETSSESISESIFNFSQEVSDIFHECEMNIMNERYNFLRENGYETQVINENAIMNAIRGIAKKFKEMWSKVKKWFRELFSKIRKVKNPDKKSVQIVTDKYKEAEKRAQDAMSTFDDLIADTDNNDEAWDSLNQAKETFEKNHAFCQQVLKQVIDISNKIIEEDITVQKQIDKNNNDLDDLISNHDDKEYKKIMNDLDKTDHELDDIIDSLKS